MPSPQAPVSRCRADEGKAPVLAALGLVVVRVVRHHIRPDVGVLAHRVRDVEVLARFEGHRSLALRAITKHGTRGVNSFPS